MSERDIVDRLRTDAAMNEEIPIKTHLWDTAKLEREAAEEIERVRAKHDYMHLRFLAARDGLICVLCGSLPCSCLIPEARASAPEDEREATVSDMTRRERFIGFLAGRNTFHGLWFHEHSISEGKFWWRNYLDLLTPTEEQEP